MDQSFKAHIGKQEERKEVHKRVWQLLILLQRVPDLFPTDSEIMLALGQRRPWPRLLVDDCEELEVNRAQRINENR